MVARHDTSPFGTRAPGPLDRTVLAATRAMPDNWLGRRLAVLFRRAITMRLGDGALDTELWGMRLRLYPRSNGCERNALFTPQMLEVVERDLLAQAIARRLTLSEPFTFVDIGANVGLYSLFVASRAGARARIVAFEPQPGILDRLRFNLAANRAVKVALFPIALADREGTVGLLIDADDAGGTHIDTGAAAAGAEVVSVPCLPSLSALDDAGIAAIDALKIDVRGVEDLVLGSFLRDAPADLLPGIVLIEDTLGFWRTDVFPLLEARGYTVLARSRQNVVLRRG